MTCRSLTFDELEKKNCFGTSLSLTASLPHLSSHFAETGTHSTVELADKVCCIAQKLLTSVWVGVYGGGWVCWGEASGKYFFKEELLGGGHNRLLHNILCASFFAKTMMAKKEEGDGGRTEKNDEGWL